MDRLVSQRTIVANSRKPFTIFAACGSVREMASATDSLTALRTYQAVVSAFTEFLTVVVHTLLYERDIYPRASFLAARKYNFPVRQNRHPDVCRWIADAIAAIEEELLKVSC